MKPLVSILKVSLTLYVALFLAQLGFYFFAPSFYVSSPNQLTIPNFIIGTFLKHFLVIFILYIVWGGLLGLWNGLLLRINLPLWENNKPYLAFGALCLAQLLATLLFLSVLYPSILNNYPGTRHLPLFINYGLLLLGIGFCAYYFLKTRSHPLSRGIPQVCLSLILPLLLLSILIQNQDLNLPEASEITVEKNNILLLGIDALDGDTGNRFLTQRLAGEKAILFENAFTPLPLTHPAWNSILTGLYPKHHGVRYFFDSPLESKHPELFLPKLLKKQGDYVSLFASDQPETSYFTKEHGFDDSVISVIGWEAHMVAMILNHFVFPAAWLNNSYVDRWVPDHFNHASLFNYDFNRFINRTFFKLKNLGAKPKFLTLHTCFLHTPVRLNLEELKNIPGFLTLAPKDFNFSKWPKPGQAQIDTPENFINPYFIRRESSLVLLDQILDELKNKGYFANSTIVLLSDHGERFVKGREIYGGVHGVDLKTREQTNVVMTFLDPGFTGFSRNASLVSLIDVAPTLLTTMGKNIDTTPFDGIALINYEGYPQPAAYRPILVESMGYINDAEEKVKFPQIPIKTLEESLTYGKNGEVTIGEDYYVRVLKKKTFEDFSKSIPDKISSHPPL